MRQLSADGTFAAEGCGASLVMAVGNFSHIVADLDRSMRFYRQGLGLEPAAPVRPFEANVAIQRAANVVGAQTRYVVLKVPGSTLGVELIEYSGIDRKPVSPRFQDPGAGNLMVSVSRADRTPAIVMRLTITRRPHGPTEAGHEWPALRMPSRLRAFVARL